MQLALFLAAIPFVVAYFVFQEKAWRRSDVSVLNLDTICLALSVLALSVLAVLVLWICSLATL